MRGSRLVWIGVAVLFMAGMFYGNVWRARAAVGLTVWVEEASPGTVESALFSTGEVETFDLIQVRAEVGGILERVYVERGDQVAEGDLLARYRLQDFLDRKAAAESALASARASLTSLSSQADKAEEQARLDLVMAEVALSEAREAYDEARRWPIWDDRRVEGERAWERAQAQYELARLSAENLKVRSEDLAAAEASYEAARFQMDQVTRDIQEIEIRSPVNAVVLEAPVRSGEQVTAGQVLFEISDPLQVKVTAKVDELDIGKVEVGQDATVTTQAYPGRSFEGKVLKISPTAKREGNVANFLVEIAINNEDGLLKPGMSVDVDIILDRVEALVLVPLEAVRDRGGVTVVWVVKDGAVEDREVHLGVSGGNLQEITHGLEAGEMVVTGPGSALRTITPGLKVEVSEGDYR